MIFSNFLFAVSVTGFIRPHGIILGGATGLGLLITHYIPMKLSVVVMIINVVLLLIAFVTMGKKFALSTLANSILYPSVMYIFETFIDLGKVTEDPMLSCVFGGVLMGIGIGLILKTGSSTGGTDVSGIVRNNSTAAFIIECLKTDTNEKEIADKVMGHYAGAVRETVEKDIAGVIEKLRSIDAIED